MIYVLLADGCEELEAMAPVDLLRRAGAEVRTVSIEKEQIVTGARGIPVAADISMDQLDFDAMEMLVLPGGYPGYENLANSLQVTELLKKADGAGKIIAAICGAPSVPGQLGLLKGQKATCYPGMEDTLGCEWAPGKVVESGRFITSRGAGTAVDFALALVARAVSLEKAAEIAKGIVYEQ